MCFDTDVRSCDLKFLEKPIFGGSANNIEGKVKLNGTKLFVVSGKWDRTVTILDCKTNEEKVCRWSPSCSR